MTARAIVFGTLLLAAACGQSTTPVAQDTVQAPSTWVDSTGRVSLTLPSNWSEMDAAAAPGASGNEILIVGPTDRSVFARCDVYVVAQQSPAPATRELLNEATEQFRDSPEMLAYRVSGNVTSADLVDVQGVRVLDTRISKQSITMLERRFFLASNGALELYTLACSAGAEDQDARLAINSVASSLQIRD